jgi:hypothetical protein
MNREHVLASVVCLSVLFLTVGSVLLVCVVAVGALFLSPPKPPGLHASRDNQVFLEANEHSVKVLLLQKESVVVEGTTTEEVRRLTWDHGGRRPATGERWNVQLTRLGVRFVDRQPPLLDVSTAVADASD